MFENLNLSKWVKEDLEDIEREHPGIFTRNTPEELKEIAKNLYWDAQSYIETAGVIENQADAIRAYLKAIQKRGN